ncbi:DUF45 domain-containing protein [Buchananella hordeovulneris]|uniref:SprT-like domain-containing protein n=1 Tax=Buchananella hordeovulneris TaxID=52770 RepID=UPI000F5D9502|nr:SprT-like domain-containing protein [Buchananella hordeovulneris]RRD52058.1 DUF45 domain-containing protein [Buchananella hordeovulneris]
MDLTLVQQQARALLARHGLPDWRLRFDRAKRRAGRCSSAHRTIWLSAPLMALYPAEAVRETILHEIAHALVGDHHGHDAVWRAQARAIGASGRARLPLDLPTVPGAWVGRCPFGHEVQRYRRPGKRAVSCARCSPRPDRRYLITWERR